MRVVYNKPVRDQIPDIIAGAIAFAVEQPYDVEIGDITIRPAVQGSTVACG